MHRHNFERRREARRQGAQTRAIVSARRHPTEQLARLDQLGHVALKERAKLAKRLKG